MADKLTPNQLRRKLDAAMGRIRLGEVHMHRNGSYYVPSSVFLNEKDMVPHVCYNPLVHDDITFARPVSEWLLKFILIAPEK